MRALATRLKPVLLADNTWTLAAVAAATTASATLFPAETLRTAIRIILLILEL